MSKSKQTLYMFTDRGIVQFWQHGRHYGMLVANSYQTATQVRQWLATRYKKRLAIAEIGTVPGETLAGHARASMAEGANCLFVATVDKAGAMQLCPVPL
jgi:hypothetical protein